jgi:5-oxoprolinase (ATP-hydrolysing)
VADDRFWRFAVDRGGTFTDCIGAAPDGALHTAKILSSDTAPVDGIRLVLERAGAIPPGAPLPRCRVRLGTTLATNALLERRGAPTVLVANRGLGDLIEIGTQERPELFELGIRKPPPLHARVVEVNGRVGADGEQIEAFDEPSARASLAEARAAGIESAAVALIHAYAHPEAEARLRDLALEVGFSHVVASHEIARERARWGCWRAARRRLWTPTSRRCCVRTWRRCSASCRARACVSCSPREA